MNNNFKVRCVDSKCFVNLYTNGKIYKVIGGIMIDDKGYKFSTYPVRNFEEFQSLSSAKWELVEDEPVNEVKRHAKAGEWIKIIYASAADGCYRNGDILSVVRNDEFGVFAKTKKTHSCINCKEGESFIGDSEYVVLENYTPPQPNMMEALYGKSEPRKPEVGDKIQIVKKGHHSPSLNIGDIHTVIVVSECYIGTNKSNAFTEESFEEFEIISMPPMPLSGFASEELLEELLRREK